MKSFREVLKIDDVKPIATGSEKRVYNHPDHPARVITETRHISVDDSEVARRGFYLRKVMHFLFPHNIPDVHMASAGLSILEKRQKDLDHIALQRAWSKYWSEKSTEPGGRIKRIEKERERDPNVIRLIEELRILGLEVDAGAVNFSYSPEGFMQYLDTLYDDGQINLAAIEEAIRSRSKEDGHAQAVNYFKRYKEIRSEQSVRSKT